jgi:hypothetical protein
MYSSTAGVIPSLIIAGLVLILSWIMPSRLSLWKGRLGASYAIGAGAASFAVAFTVLNLAVQWQVVSVSLVGKEVANGALALRVISVTAAIMFVRIIREGMNEPEFTVSVTEYEDWPEDWPDFVYTSSPEDASLDSSELFAGEELRRADWPVERRASQATALLLVLCLLWALQVLGRDSVSIALLNWSFAFSSDDFFMAASYRAEREVLPPRFDARLIWVWRITTLTLFCFVAFQQFAWWQASLIIVPTAYFLLLPKLTEIGNKMSLKNTIALTELSNNLKDLGRRTF